jgi:predicted house-cleaning noncanonical NTP pyrophosphatase (MazG superfamily)
VLKLRILRLKISLELKYIEMKYDKLIRDKIPEIIKSKGEECVTHIANDDEYWEKLTSKLIEEAHEYKDDPSTEEMADIMEVIHAILAFKKIDPTELEKIRLGKKNKKGGFDKRIILEES